MQGRDRNPTKSTSASQILELVRVSEDLNTGAQRAVLRTHDARAFVLIANGGHGADHGFLTGK